MEKKVIFPGLKQYILPVCPQNTLFYTFSDQIHPPQISKSTKKCIYTVFLDKFQTVSLFFTLSFFPTLLLSFKFLLSPIRSVSKLNSPKFCFQSLCLSKVMEVKPLGRLSGTRRTCRAGEKSHLRMYTRDMFLQRFFEAQKTKIFLVTFGLASSYKTTCL